MSTEAKSCRIKEIGTLAIDRYEGISRILNAMSNKTRVAILHVMTQHNEVCACELEPALQLPQPTITTHLRKMYDIGLLKRREVWKFSYYFINPEYEKLVSDVLKGLDVTTMQSGSPHPINKADR